jgi:hypothetical protein
MNLHWSMLDEAILTCSSRNSAIRTLWRMVPEDERTPTRRKFTIAVVDMIREHVELHGPQKPTVEGLEPIVTGGKDD